MTTYNTILPSTETAGAVVYRDAAGQPTYPPDVTHAYVPLPAFKSTCELTALPSTCDARIEPAQINAIVSELLSFAECLDPTGTWDCNSLKNLCASFSNWMIYSMSNIIVSDLPPPDPRENQLWWESDTGMLFISYNDGDTIQWVQVVAGNTIVVDQVSIVGEGSSLVPYSVALIDCGEY